MKTAQKLSRLFLFSALATAVVALQGCGVSKDYFGASLEATATAQSPCTPQQATNLKISFLVDASGSTVQDDPNAQIRGTAALNFVNANSSNPNLTYSFGYFGQTYQPVWDFSLSQAAGTNDFVTSPAQSFGNASLTVGAVNEFVSLFNAGKIPGSGTNYQTAFAELQSVIGTDAFQNPNSNYVVIFMSDGQPNKGGTSQSDIEGYAQSLMNSVGSGRITLSAVYFNDAANADATEDALMSDIATIGQGQYVNTLSAGSSLDLNTMIQNLIVVPANACMN